MNIGITCRNYLKHIGLKGRYYRLINQRALKPVGPIRFSKLINNGDIQLWEMVQGGLIMRLIENSADIVANTHTNRFASHKQSDKLPYASLAGVERVEMISSATVGNVLELYADVVEAGEDKVRCRVQVYKRTIEDQTVQQLINQSFLWYVPLYAFDARCPLAKDQIVSDIGVNQLDSFNREFYVQKIRKRKDAGRLDFLERMRESICESEDMQLGIQKSLLGTSYHIPPSECSVRGFLKGGPLMVWIDELAAAIAVNFSNKQCITRSMDNITFFSPVKQGSNISLYGRPAFKSQRTLDIQVIGFINSSDGLTQQLCLEAFVSFVMLNAADEPVVQDVKILSEDDRIIFDERLRYYTERKRLIEELKK